MDGELRRGVRVRLLGARRRASTIRLTPAPASHTVASRPARIRVPKPGGYEAVSSGGAFIVYESIIDDERRKNAFGLLMSLNMLIETPGGFDYTGADCIGWMKEAGFRDGFVEHLVGPDSMVVGLK